MKSLLLGSVVCIVGSMISPGTAFAQQEADWKPVPVAGLDGWSDPAEWWSEQDGVVAAESKGGEDLPRWHYLLWDGSLPDNFELQLEYRIVATAPQDAGVNFRVTRSVAVNEKGNLIGYQAELDTAVMYGRQKWIRQGKLFGHIHDGKRGRMFKRGSSVSIDATGKETATALPREFVPARVFRKPPAWNECRVRVEGDLIQLYLNGVLANELRDQDPQNRADGDAIALQFRPNSAYRFEVRDIRYRSLSR